MDAPLTIAFSPCPNDTFIFDALVNSRVDTLGLRFKPVLADIADLNRMAERGAADVCKVSYFAYALKLRANWHLLDSGSALGRGCGPLLVRQADQSDKDWRSGPIAIPGVDTTAHFLLNFYDPDSGRREPLLFSEIMPAVAAGHFPAGVIIHESRFVYQRFALELVADLGAVWEERAGLPIPLGGIVARKSLGEDVLQKLERVISDSVSLAFERPETAMNYVRQHAQEMEDEVQRAHIALYVNEFTKSLGVEGHAAVSRMILETERQASLRSGA